MSSKLLKNKEFNSIVGKFYRKHRKDILDIVLFGSAVKGKDKPEDVDILLLFREKEDLDIAYELRKSLERFGVQVTTKTYENLFSTNFKARGAFLSDGYSLIKKQFIANRLGYSSAFLLKYNLHNFSQSKRMQLQYALYGRNKKSGIVKELKLKKFSNNVFFCPVENSEKLKEFFEHWGISFDMFPIIISDRVVI